MNLGIGIAVPLLSEIQSAVIVWPVALLAYTIAESIMARAAVLTAVADENAGISSEGVAGVTIAAES